MSDEKILYKHKKIVESPSFLDNRGYKIKIPDEFVEKFVEIWNRSYTSNIDAGMATKFITHLVQTLIVLVDNYIPIFFPCQYPKKPEGHKQDKRSLPHIFVQAVLP